MAFVGVHGGGFTSISSSPGRGSSWTQATSRTPRRRGRPLTCSMGQMSVVGVDRRRAAPGRRRWHVCVGRPLRVNPNSWGIRPVGAMRGVCAARPRPRAHGAATSGPPGTLVAVPGRCRAAAMALRRWGCVAVVAVVAMVVVVVVVPVRVRGPVGAGFPSRARAVVSGSPSTVTAHWVPAQAPLQP